jgi:hypothetical protein
MRCNGAIIAGSVLLMLVASGRAQEVRVSPRGQQKSIGTFDRAEWSIDPARTYHNPFNPDEVAADATFTAPSGKTVAVPAFWDAGNTFVVRFAPTEPGKWSFNVTVIDSSGSRTSPPSKFEVNPSQRRGFIRRAANNRYLRFDSGESFFPVGLNLCWASSNEAPAEWYDESFKTLADNGANYVRVWMCHPDAMIESPNTGLGQYNLTNAAFFDKVLESADRHGIGIMLCFMNHRELLDKDQWGPAGWPALPYNARNAGPATQPIDFFTHPDARRAFKARLRYIVARYSAFTSVAFWEIFNEQEFTKLNIPLAWNGEMTSYLRKIDPAKHLITTSAKVPDEVWELPDIDLTQTHIYGDGSQIDMVTPIASSAIEVEQFNKPHLVGETGLDSNGPDTKYDPKGKGTTFHNALWASALSGNAGSGMYWWWDNYIGPENLSHEFKPVSEFVSPVDWAGKHFEPVVISQLVHSQAKDELTDLIILPSGSWGIVAKKPVVIPVNGRPPVSIPRYFCGPRHTDLYFPVTLEVDLPEASELVLDIDQVSDFSTLRILIDGKAVHDLAFSALPGSEYIKKTTLNTEHQLYVADLNKTFRLPISAGHHQVTLDPVAGDWMTLSKISFTKALPAKYADLAGYAVQDAASHETLVWLLNTRSNWKEDQSQDSPPQQQAVELTVPNIESGKFAAQWWDTRKGQTIRTDDVTAKDGRLTLDVPTFNRDIALRLH